MCMYMCILIDIQYVCLNRVLIVWFLSCLTFTALAICLRILPFFGVVEFLR